MQLTKVPFSKTQSFSQFFLDYIEQKEPLRKYYHRFPTIEAFREQIKEKQVTFQQTTREILADVLLQQYQHLNIDSAVQKRITLLRSNTTFTVTTGHQLNIFTGPLYFIYKIVTVINTCKQLKKAYPDYNFLPVYWMASEDHDYDEIKSFRLHGKKYTWTTSQQGAVGRFSTDGFTELLNDLPGDIGIFKDAYTKNKTLSDAVRHYVHHLFVEEDLLIVDADHPSLKSTFKNVMMDDVIHHTVKPLVDKTSSELESIGYKTQVFCRDVNFFYLEGHSRDRLEVINDESFGLIDTDKTLSREALKRTIEESPEKLSPNVILRPLYQETILPNLAYVGGPAEVVYWLQLKAVFDKYQMPFPILMPRNFAAIIEPHIKRKLNKTGLSLDHVFQDKNDLYNHWVLKNSTHNLSTESERATLLEIYSDLRKRAESIDVTLGQFVGAEQKRLITGLEKIEHKMLRAEKRIQQEKLGQIDAVKDALFPNGNLQERTDNFLNFYQTDKDFVKKLLNLFDPFDYQFNVIHYE